MAGEKYYVFTLSGKKKKQIELPDIFKAELREDLIKRAVIASISHRIQPKGSDKLAGKRTSAEYLGTGRAISRVPRIKSSPFYGRAAFAPGTVKGRKAHPPKVEKVIAKKINKKERIKAIISAIAATAKREIVEKRGHRIGMVKQIPLIVEDKLEEIKKAKEAAKVFEALGLSEDLERARNISYRAGKGKMRGRRYKKKKSLLIVIAEDKGIKKAAANFPGVDIASVDELGAEHLAPGAHAGRLTLYTQSALKLLAEKYGSI